MKYDPDKFTWGYELELGDVSRKLPIPKELGEWEYAETDIVNQREPYRYRAADPQGIDPPVGGEINTRPTKTIKHQVEKINSILNYFRMNGCDPTVGCMMEGHIHVHVPGLKEDIKALKRLTRYIGSNHDCVVAKTVGYKERSTMKLTKTARTYMKWDIARRMPWYMVMNIQEMATNFDDFIRIQQCGKDGVSRGMPIRYAINTYCLKHTNTIEFRCFWATLDLSIIRDCFEFVHKFLMTAFHGEQPVSSYIDNYRFQPFRYNHEEYLGWEQTKWSKERGKKQRKYISI